MCLCEGGKLMSLEKMLRQLRETCGSTASAVVSRDGLVIAEDMLEGVSRETFAIMCATILGAGMTAATELRVSPPTHIVLSTKETRIHIFEGTMWRSEEHTSELQSLAYLVCRLLLEKKKKKID